MGEIEDYWREGGLFKTVRIAGERKDCGREEECLIEVNCWSEGGLLGRLEIESESES